MNRPEVEAAARRCEYWLARADWFAARGFDVLAGLSREIAGGVGEEGVGNFGGSQMKKKDDSLAQVKRKSADWAYERQKKSWAYDFGGPDKCGRLLGPENPDGSRPIIAVFTGSFDMVEIIDSVTCAVTKGWLR